MFEKKETGVLYIHSAVKAVIRRQDKFLVVRQVVGNIEVWDLPGGRCRFGETPYEALEREVKEETGLGCTYRTFGRRMVVLSFQGGRRSSYLPYFPVRTTVGRNTITQREWGGNHQRVSLGDEGRVLPRRVPSFASELKGIGGRIEVELVILY